jgi:hypothetical protein
MCTAAGSGVSGWGRASAWRAAAQCGTHALTVHSTSSSVATASARPGKCSARRASCAARLSAPLRDGPASALLIVGGEVEEERVTEKAIIGAAWRVHRARRMFSRLRGPRARRRAPSPYSKPWEQVDAVSNTQPRAAAKGGGARR